MRINHNLAALNTIRQLGINSNNTQKALEKLSSGLRINSAADDAAGLAISEKMRGQISGLEMAQKNAQDGISLVSTAEGALNETHSILQRMRELAVQSSNDTNTNDDRAQLQKEMDQLSKEVTRIGNDTQFNTQNLLDGSFQGTFQIGANAGQNISLSIGDMRGYTLGVAGDVKVSGTETQTATASSGSDLAYTLANGTGNVITSGSTFVLKSGTTTVATSTDGKTFTGVSGGAATDDTFTLSTAVVSGDSIKISGTSVTATHTSTTATDAGVTNNGLQAGTYTYHSGTGYLTDEHGNNVAKSTDGKTFTDMSGSKTLFTAAGTLSNNASIQVGGTDISTQSGANSAITEIDDAINKVSTQRSTLGAYQNRLEHTINNLGTSSQNLTAAESRIRDVDMAKEMAEFTKNNILNQAAQAMLAQANNLPQGVLQLLK